MCSWQVTSTFACQLIRMNFNYNPHLSYSPFLWFHFFPCLLFLNFHFQCHFPAFWSFFFFHSTKDISSIYLKLSFEQVDAIFYIFFPLILSVIASYSFYHFPSDDTILHFTYSRMPHPWYKTLREPIALNSVFHILLNKIFITIQYGSKKSVPLQARSGPEGSRKLKFSDFMTTAQDGGKVVSLTHRPLFTPRKYSWYSFLLEAESTPGP